MIKLLLQTYNFACEIGEFKNDNKFQKSNPRVSKKNKFFVVKISNNTLREWNK
jgi:hypothetical protein